MTKPVETLRDGAIKATIWKNTGEKGDYYSVDLTRIYKDKDDHYQDTHSFSSHELLRVAHLAERAYDRVAVFRQTVETDEK